MSTITTAVILAAGRGTRIEPFSYTRPKALIPIANKPIIVHQLEALDAVGIKKVIIIAGWKNERMNHWLFRNRKYFEHMSIEIKIQPQPTGTAHALSLAESSVDTEFLVLYGDTIVSVEQLKFVMDQGAHAVAINTIETHNYSWQILIDDDEESETYGHIRQFTYNSREWATTVPAGIFALTKEVFKYLKVQPGFFIHTEVGISGPEEYDLFGALEDMRQEGKTIRPVMMKNNTHDIDYPWEIMTVSYHIAEAAGEILTESYIDATSKIDGYIEGEVIIGENVIIEEGVTIAHNVRIGANTIIRRGTSIKEDTIIGEHCEIGPYARIGGVFGNDVHIGFTAECDGVWFDKAWCMHHSEMYGVFGEGVNIGAATVCGTLRHDDKPIKVDVNGERIDTGLIAIGPLVGDYARTGVNAMPMPGRIIGAYALVGPGVIQMQNVPPRHIIIAKTENIIKPI